MPLLDIYNYVQERTNLKEVSRFLRYANVAMAELWISFDPELQEIFVRSEQEAIISLPYYVDRVRAVKDVGSEAPMILNSPRPWYGQLPRGLPFVELSQDSALEREITNASTLTVKRTSAGRAINVIVVGEGREGFHQRAVVSLTATAKEGETSIPFLRVHSIARSDYDDCDTQILDAEENLLAVVPMRSLHSRYTRIRVVEKSYEPGEPLYFAIYYKPARTHLLYETDVIPDKLEQALLNKILELSSAGTSEEAIRLASMYGGKAKGALTNAQRQHDVGVDAPMQTGPLPYERPNVNIHRF